MKILLFFLSIFTSMALSFLLCSALTPEQIIKLKEAGVSNKTIQIMLIQEKEGVHEVKDDQDNVYIDYSINPSLEKTMRECEEEEKVNKSWKMLEGIIIDQRQK